MEHSKYFETNNGIPFSISLGPHTRQFDFIGAYLNSVVVSISCLPIASGILNLIVPLRYPDSLVLRSVGILPPVTKMVISLVAVLLLAWHCIIMNFGAIIILSNVALMCHSPLAVSKFSTNLDLEIGFLYRYPVLEIIVAILNEGYCCMIPVELGCAFL